MAERATKRARSTQAVAEVPSQHEFVDMDAEATSNGVRGDAVHALDYMTLLAADSPDVLSHIYTLAHCTVAVSQQLLPFSQKLLYPRIRLTTLRQLQRFIRTVISDRRGTVTNKLPPESLVLELSLEIGDDDDDDDEFEMGWEEFPEDVDSRNKGKGKDSDEGPDYTVDYATLRTFFSRLTSLRYLKINDLRESIHAAVTPLPGALLHLERLVIGWIGPSALDPTFYVGLNSYPNLGHLSLNVGCEDFGSDRPVKKVPLTPNYTVKRLQLGLIDGDAVERCRHLLSLFSQLDELSVEVDSTFTLQPGVTLVDVSPQLKRLSIISRKDEMPPPPLPILNPIDMIINRFRFLEALQLSPCTFTPNLFPLLSKFPYLVFLSLDINSYSQLTATSLLGILVGPRIIPNLEALLLNDISPTSHNSPPKWTLEISFELMVNLANAAEEVGVHLGGNIVDRYENELEIMAEKKMLEMGIDESKLAELDGLGFGEEMDDEAFFQKALLAMKEKGGGGLESLISGNMLDELFGAEEA